VSGYKGGVSFAQNDYANKDQTELVAQEVDVFQGTTAATVMKDLRTVAAECATYTNTDDHAQVKVTGESAAGLGDEAYTMTLTSGHWQNGQTLIAARSGNSVVTVLSTAGGDNGAASAKKVTAEILDALKGLKTA
jgi:tRNA(Ile2) C34 agmatinyltransferase TiaS